MLFDKIIERENEFVNYCDNYSGQKICLFGSGEGAVRVYRYLQKRNISVASIAGARDYIESARKRMKNLVGGA